MRWGNDLAVGSRQNSVGAIMTLMLDARGLPFSGHWERQQASGSSGTLIHSQDDKVSGREPA